MRTKKPMKTLAVRITAADFDFLRTAATRLDESVSYVVREAIREKVARILLHEQTAYERAELHQ